MKEEAFYLNGTIPALLWGEGDKGLYIAVHGDESHKGDDALRTFAQTATAAGYRVLSFDLPCHGERKNGQEAMVWDCVRDLEAVLQYAKGLSAHIRLFAVSLGAYYSLVAYNKERFESALFLSPVVNMRRLLQGMMAYAGVTEQLLHAKREIATPMGKTLRWKYWKYVNQHPVGPWHTPTHVLYGGQDAISERYCVTAFCSANRCTLTILPEEPHYFHTPQQLQKLTHWATERL